MNNKNRRFAAASSPNLSDADVVRVAGWVYSALRRDLKYRDWRDVRVDPNERITEWCFDDGEWDSLAELTLDMTITKICGERPTFDDMARWFGPPDHPKFAWVRDEPAERLGTRGLANWVAARRPLAGLREVEICGSKSLVAAAYLRVAAIAGRVTRNPFGPSSVIADVIPSRRLKRFADDVFNDMQAEVAVEESIEFRGGLWALAGIVGTAPWWMELGESEFVRFLSVASGLAIVVYDIMSSLRRRSEMTFADIAEVAVERHFELQNAAAA